MNPHLYLVHHRIHEDDYISPCVGDEELIAHSHMVEHFGAKLVSVKDLEPELSCFVESCYIEGLIEGWANVR